MNEEYSQDTKVSFSTKDVQNGINHLICLGKGELKDRQVVHLYSDEKGNISQTQTFTGLSERTSTYDYSSAETLDDLIKGGTERLKELINYKQFDMTVDETVADIGDIVGGREYTTGFLIKQQITQKILRASNDSWSVEFKVGGSIKSSQPIGGGGVDYGVQINDLSEKYLELQEQINTLHKKEKVAYTKDPVVSFTNLIIEREGNIVTVHGLVRTAYRSADSRLFFLKSCKPTYLTHFAWATPQGKSGAGYIDREGMFVFNTLRLPGEDDMYIGFSYIV